MLALRARAYVAGSLASVAENEMRPGQRLTSADDAARDWALLPRIDPSNMISRSNLAFTRLNAAGALWDLGRPRDALAKLLDSRDLDQAAAASSAGGPQAELSVLRRVHIRRRARTGGSGRQIHGRRAAPLRALDARRCRRRPLTTRLRRTLWAVGAVELARLQGDPLVPTLPPRAWTKSWCRCSRPTTINASK